MSRGLGETERKVMDIVTYPNVDDWINIREILLVCVGSDDTKDLSFNEGIEKLCCHDDHACYIYCRWSIQKSLGKGGRVFYQSLMRAIRSLERKGFIVSQLEDADGIPKEELKETPLTKKISFNSKCLNGSIPWQLKYLNKRLTKFRGVQSD